MVCQALELFYLHQVLGIPPLTKRLDSCEPLHFCDRCGPHRTSDQTECLVLDLVKGLLVGLCCGCPLCGAILEMGSDYSLVHCFKYFLACSPSGTSKSLRRIASLRLTFASALAMCCFQVCLLSNVIPRYVASSSSFSGVPPRVMVPAFCFGDRVNKVVEDLSLLNAIHHFSVQLLSLPAANCILYVAVVAYSSFHQITKSSAYNAALTPFGSSGTRSLMNSRNNVGDRIPPCGTPCLSRIFLLSLLPCGC